jgi:hypothetical protein
VAASLANLAWGDTFVFTAPPGVEQVSVRFTLELDGTLSAICSTGSGGCEAAAVTNLSSPGFGGLAPGLAVQLGDVPNPVSPPATSDAIVTFFAGSRVPIVSQLFVSSFSDPSYPNADLTTADFGSTDRFFIDLLTPGAQYTTESGHIYPGTGATQAQAPEPATFRFVLVGLGGIVGLIQRRS